MRVPLEPDQLRLPEAEGEPPRLVGSFSPAAGLCFFPRRHNCPITFGPVEDRLLATRGALYSWTYIYEERFGGVALGAGGYGVGQVDLPEGPRIQARLKGAFGDWRIGMEMELDLLPLTGSDGPELDAAGNELVGFCFRPVEAKP
jgi:uncharacterized OB-fold protein